MYTIVWLYRIQLLGLFKITIMARKLRYGEKTKVKPYRIPVSKEKEVDKAVIDLLDKWTLPDYVEVNKKK